MYKRFIKGKLLLGSLLMLAVFGMLTLLPGMAKADNNEAGLITSPVTSNMWSGAKNITWDASKCSTVTETMDITYSTDGYNYSSNIISSVICSAGSYTWNTSNVSNGSNYTIRIYRNGGSVFATSGVFKIDNTTPTLNVVDGVSATPVKSDTISFTASDNLSGVNFTGYAIKSDTEACSSIANYTAASNSFVIAGNYTTGLCMKVTDNAGNAYYQDLGLLHTDNTAPTMEAVLPADGSNLKGDFTLVYDFSDLNLAYLELDIFRPGDTQSTKLQVTLPADTSMNSKTSTELSPFGVKSVNYDIDTQKWTIVVDTTNSIWEDGDTKFYVEVGDLAGNKWGDMNGVTKLYTYKFDNVIPATSLSVAANDGSNGWYKTTPTITLSCTDTTSGCDKIYYKWGSTASYSEYSTAVTAPEGKNTLYYYSTDKAGNVEVAKTQEIKVDTALPTVSVDTDIITKSQITTNATASDTTSGLNTYVWSANSSNVTFGTANTLNSTVSANTDGVYQITLTVTDQAGNSNSDTFELTWDTTKSISSLVSNPVSADGSNGWYKSVPTITISCTDGTSGCDKIYYKWGSTASYSEYSTAVTAPEGTNTLYYYSTDKAGNVEEANTQDFKVDTTKPIVDVGADIITYASFSRTATASDTTSGLNTYVWSATSTAVSFTGTESLTKNISASADGVYEITLTVTDQAGNSNSDIFELTWDATSPSFSIADGTATVPVKTDTIKITVSDTNIDASKLFYGFSANDTCDASDTYSTSFTSGTDFTIAGNHKDYLCVKATDLAGNNAYSTVGQLNTDNTAPSLSSVNIVSNNANTSLATVGNTITLTFVANENLQSLPTVTIMGNAATTTGSDKNWTATYTLTDSDTSNGSIPFTIDFNDIAGNAGTQVTKTNDNSLVTYDNTAPSVMTIVVTPTTVYDGALSISVSATYSETMLDSAPKISFSVATSAFTSSNNGSWDEAKKIWTETFTTTDEDEEAQVTLTINGAKDAAGNTQIQKTKSFDIDTLNPSIAGSVTISSNNSNLTRAKVGDTITVNFSTSENVKKPSVTIAGKTATVTGSDKAWTATYTMTSGETEGTISYAIDFNDIAGNAATTVNGTSVIIFDKTAATISLVSILSSNSDDSLAKVGDTITLIFSTDEAVSLGDVKIAGHSVEPIKDAGTDKYTATYTMQDTDTEGMIAYEINVADLAGNTSKKEKAAAEDTVNFDRTAATINLISITSNNSDDSLAKVGDTITLVFSTDEEVTLGEVEIAGNIVKASSTLNPNEYTAIYTMQDDDTEGMISYEINVADLAGNISQKVKETSENTVNFDKTAPVISNLSPADGDQTSDTTPKIGANFVESASGSSIDLETAVLKLDGTNVSAFSEVKQNGAYYQPIAALEDGIHTATLIVSDKAGNLSLESIWSFEVAATAKSLSINSDKANVFADGTSRAKITVQVLDAGLPVNSGEVCFSSSMGTISDATATPLESPCVAVNGNGLAIVYVSSCEVGNATINAVYNFSGESKSGSANVQFIDTVKTITLSASANSILANGKATSTISARVFGNGILMEGALVSFSTDLGDLSDITDTSASISSAVPGTATVTATYNTGSELITKTIEIELISADKTKPTAVTNPLDNANNVPITIRPVITFSEKMKESTLSDSKIKLVKYSNGDEVPCTLQVETIDDITAVTIIPNSPLEKGTQYYYTISTVEDLAGNKFDPTWTSTNKASHEFTTRADVTSYSINLNSGWNLISLPLIPEDSNIDSVLSTIADVTKVEIVKSYDSISGTWSSYVPSAQTGDLTSMEDGKGYWIKMTTGDVLTINGSQTPSAEVTPRSYPIVGNAWNLIGFKSAQTMGVSEYVSEIGDTDVVWEYNQDGYSSIYNNVYKLGIMKPGYGYWLFAHDNAYSIVPSAY